MDLRHILTECLLVTEATNNETVKKLAIDVYDIVLKEINRQGKKPNDQPSKQQINEIQKKLKVLMHQYGISVKERDKFFEKFPDWREIRLANIKGLREIAEWINYHRNNCNISKLAACISGIVGGALCVASAVSIPFTFGATTPLGIAGAAMIGAGAGTSFGAAIAETSLEAKNVNCANKLIDKDKEKLQETLSWYQHSEELKKAMDDVMGFDAMNELLKQATEFVDQFKQVRDAIESDKFLSVVKKMINVMSRISGTHIVGFIPLIITIIIVTVYIDKKNRFMVDTIFFIKRSAVLIGLVLDLFTDGAVCVLQGIKGVSPVVLRAAARGALAGAGIAVDIASLVLTSIDIHKGSISKNAENMKILADKMEEELNHFQDTYDKLLKKKERRKKREEKLLHFQD